MKNSLIIVALCMLVSVSTASAESEFMDTFMDNYSTLDQDLLNHPGEYAEIENFVYEKDLATFTFQQGEIYLLRYIHDRPTTALFFGTGTATVDMPTHVERSALQGVTGDSTVNETFETCFIRIGDDFDLKLKEQFTFEAKELSWKEFNIAKQTAGEIFFKPTIFHRYDDYFQLLRSIYERSADGFFWIDFNKYVFSYDPNRPEQVQLAYEYESADQDATHAVRYQRDEAGIYDDSMMSQIAYPTTMIEQEANITMGGLDGRDMRACEATSRLVINDDSLRFVSLFLHYNLKEDSIYFEGRPVDYHRRKDFNFIGIVLPRYYYKGDTLTFRLWYDGKNYFSPVPYVEDPTPTPLVFTFTVPKGYNYLMPGMGPREDIGNGQERFTVRPPMPFHMFRFWGFAQGYDTTQVLSDIGVTMNLINSDYIDKRNYECYVPRKEYDTSIVSSFNFMSGRFGGPPGVFAIDVYPLDGISMPGVMSVSQISCVTDGYMSAVGGIHMYSGTQAGMQWFGQAMRPMSRREEWFKTAPAEYLGMLYIQNEVDGSNFYSNLAARRDSIHLEVRNRYDMPVASGDRANITLRRNKGVWMMHMLRILMLDTENLSDGTFMKMMAESAMRFNMTRFSNHDFVALAEKHHGESLTDFFDHWLYGIDYPRYDLEYAIVPRDGDYVIDVTCRTEVGNPDFAMPVLMRVELADGTSTFVREPIPAGESTFTIGPFDVEPKEMEFNEFYSVLCDAKVNKR